MRHEINKEFIEARIGRVQKILDRVDEDMKELYQVQLVIDELALDGLKWRAATQAPEPLTPEEKKKLDDFTAVLRQES